MSRFIIKIPSMVKMIYILGESIILPIVIIFIICNTEYLSKLSEIKSNSNGGKNTRIEGKKQCSFHLV